MIHPPALITVIAVFAAAISVFLHWQTRQACRRHHQPRRATRLNPSIVDTEDVMPPVSLPDIPVTLHVGDKKSIQLSPDHPLAGAPTFASSDESVVTGSVSAADPDRFDLSLVAPGTATIKIVGEGDPDPSIDELDQSIIFTVLAAEATTLNPAIVDTPTA
jgi:hypothetical protein